MTRTKTTHSAALTQMVRSYLSYIKTPMIKPQRSLLVIPYLFCLFLTVKYKFYHEVVGSTNCHIQGRQLKKNLNTDGFHYLACGRVRWSGHSPFQDTAVPWALSYPAHALIQEWCMSVLGKFQNTVGCSMKPLTERGLPVLDFYNLFFCGYY